ncbi:hypothetical protein ABIF83_004437 [Bradyrhizobium ottawaense]
MRRSNPESLRGEKLDCFEQPVALQLSNVHFKFQCRRWAKAHRAVPTRFNRDTRCVGTLALCPPDDSEVVTRRHAISSSRRFRPSFALFAPSMKGRREGRVPAGTRKTPVRTHCTRNARGRHRAADHPAFPARWSDGVWRALPGDEFLLASVTPRIDDALRPVGLGAPPQGLAVATTARTTRFGRTHQRRSSARRRDLTGFSRPAPASRARRCLRPPLPDPRLVTTYDRPFRRIRMGDTYVETEFR